MGRVIPLSVVLYPLWYVFKVCVNRSRSRQMRKEDDDFHELETRYKEGKSAGIGHMSGKRGPYLEMPGAVRSAVMPAAKVGVLESKLPNPKLVMKEADVKMLLKEFTEPVNREVAIRLLKRKLKSQEGVKKAVKKK